MIQDISLLNSIKGLNNQYFKLLIIHGNNSKVRIKTVNNLTLSNINKIIFKDDFCDIKTSQIEDKLDEQIEESSLPVFYNFESLFRPEFRFDLMTFLKQKSKNKKIIVIWPGDIRKNQLIYSRPDRNDYYIHKIDNYTIIQEL